MKLRPLFLLLIASNLMTACKPPQPSADYLAVCDGQPLRTVARRSQAMEDGYDIDRRYDCITKQSAKKLAEEKAQWLAANTPEALAAEQMKHERRRAEEKMSRDAAAKLESEARAEQERQWAAAEATPIQAVDINSATEAQLKGVEGLSTDDVADILKERKKRSFYDWGDLVNRVVGLSSAETAARASAFGLTVNGRSISGAEPNSDLAKYARDKWRRRGE